MPTLHLQLSNKDTVAKSEYTINVNSAESVNLAIAVSALGQRLKFASARLENYCIIVKFTLTLT